MKDSDLILQRLRQDTQLRVSLCAYLEEYKAKLLQELPYVNDLGPIQVAQGGIRGVDRLIARIKQETKGVADEADEPAISRNGH